MNQRWPGLELAVLLILGLWLRWRFIHEVHLYPDEFVTLLAARLIAQKGWPVMPSGLFYEHGLLFSYLAGLAWLLAPSYLAVRYASLLLGGLTLLFTFWLGQRWFSAYVALIAAAGLAIAPMAIHWSGRARMYALLQFLVLLTLWLAYEGLSRNKAHLCWAALLVYLGATLAHFVAVTLAPALALTAILLWRLGLEAEEQGSKGAGEQGSKGAREQIKVFSILRFRRWRLWAEGLALGGVLVVAFLVKRAGQPKGIEALEAGPAGVAAGLAQVFEIYTAFSFNPIEGWQAISPFYFTLPALIFTPFALLAGLAGLTVLNGKGERKKGRKEEWKSGRVEDHQPSNLSTFQSPTLFLSLILLVVTLEMIFFISSDRRDDKYLFMLLPVLFLLGGQGLLIIINRLFTTYHSLITILQSPPSTPFGKRSTERSHRRLRASLHPPSSILYPLSSILYPLSSILAVLILILTWPQAQNLLANTGDDYETAFAYVRDHWQEGDKVLTGTPPAAAFYLGRNDFYSVQRRGGYDYRLLVVADQEQPVDRWLASPVIRTEADLHATLARHQVWLVLERWGLQREYYDLLFQQQLLAQTDYKTETQGIFVLHSKTNPRPLASRPAQPIKAANSEAHPIFGDVVQLTGYTIEPEEGRAGQPLRLTLYWQATAPILHDYTVFVHLRSPEGTTVVQADHRPLGNLYPTSLWPVSELIRESSDLTLPPDLPPGPYELWVGLYLLETGERLPVRADTSGENAVRLGSLEIGD